MNKKLIAAFVAALIIFVWQFISYMFLGLHALKTAPNGDQIISMLSTNITEDGMYMAPGPPPDATNEQKQEWWKANEGKPHAMIQYHGATDMGMGRQMLVGFILNFLASWLVISVVLKTAASSFGERWKMVMCFPVFIIIMSHLMGWNWWGTTWSWALNNIIDELVMWGLAGAWIAWYLGHNKVK